MSKSVVKKITPMKKAIKKRLAKKKAPTEEVSWKRKPVAGRLTAEKRRPHSRKRRERKAKVSIRWRGLGTRSGEQSGDLQGLSNVEGADSQSVATLSAHQFKFSIQ